MKIYHSGSRNISDTAVLDSIAISIYSIGSENIKENWLSRFDKKEIAEKCLRWALATKPVVKEVKRLELEEEN